MSMVAPAASIIHVDGSGTTLNFISCPPVTVPPWKLADGTLAMPAYCTVTPLFPVMTKLAAFTIESDTATSVKNPP